MLSVFLSGVNDSEATPWHGTWLVIRKVSQGLSHTSPFYFGFHLYRLLTSPLLLMFIQAPLLNWKFVILCFQAARQTKTPPEFIVAAAYNFSDDWIRIGSSPINHSAKDMLFLNIHQCWWFCLWSNRRYKWPDIGEAAVTANIYLRCKPHASFLWFVLFVSCSCVWFCLVFSCIWFPCFCIISCVSCFLFPCPHVSFKFPCVYPLSNFHAPLLSLVL